MNHHRRVHEISAYNPLDHVPTSNDAAAFYVEWQFFCRIIFTNWHWCQLQIQFSNKFLLRTKSSQPVDVWYVPEYRNVNLISCKSSLRPVVVYKIVETGRKKKRKEEKARRQMLNEHEEGPKVWKKQTNNQTLRVWDAVLSSVHLSVSPFNPP